MFESFLDRLSKSEYKDKFILKGGLLIAAIVGLDYLLFVDVCIPVVFAVADVAQFGHLIDGVAILPLELGLPSLALIQRQQNTL